MSASHVSQWLGSAGEKCGILNHLSSLANVDHIDFIRSGLPQVSSEHKAALVVFSARAKELMRVVTANMGPRTCERQAEVKSALGSPPTRPRVELARPSGKSRPNLTPAVAFQAVGPH